MRILVADVSAADTDGAISLHPWTMPLTGLEPEGGGSQSDDDGARDAPDGGSAAGDAVDGAAVVPKIMDGDKVVAVRFNVNQIKAANALVVVRSPLNCNIFIEPDNKNKVSEEEAVIKIGRQPSRAPRTVIIFVHRETILDPFSNFHYVLPYYRGFLMRELPCGLVFVRGTFDRQYKSTVARMVKLNSAPVKKTSSSIYKLPVRSVPKSMSRPSRFPLSSSSAPANNTRSSRSTLARLSSGTPVPKSSLGSSPHNKMPEPSPDGKETTSPQTPSPKSWAANVMSPLPDTPIESSPPVQLLSVNCGVRHVIDVTDV